MFPSYRNQVFDLQNQLYMKGTLAANGLKHSCSIRQPIILNDFIENN